MKNQVVNKLVLITGYLLLIVGITFITPSVKTVAGSIPAEGNTDLELVNELRASKGLNTLNWNENLSSAAKLKAGDMVSNNYFEHTSPTGRNAWDFLLSSGYNYKFAGENLAIDLINVTDAQKAWENSPTHLINILSVDYSDFGLAEIEGNIGDRKTHIYVQLFGAK